jgi:hypothetical protein
MQIQQRAVDDGWLVCRKALTVFGSHPSPVDLSFDGALERYRHPRCFLNASKTVMPLSTSVLTKSSASTSLGISCRQSSSRNRGITTTPSSGSQKIMSPCPVVSTTAKDGMALKRVGLTGATFTLPISIAMFRACTLASAPVPTVDFANAQICCRVA